MTKFAAISPVRAPTPPERRRLILLLGAILTFGFLATTLASFFVSRGSLRETIVGSELPLIADNIYSEIQKDLIRPILISATMASDTFLRDWVIAGEPDVDRMTRYLKEVKTRFGAFTSFFISERTRIYYHADGILKTVSEQEPRDVWYFRVRTMAPDYEINVDPDLANADALTIFINYRVFDYAGKYIGAAGVGLTVNAVQSLIRKYRERFAREIYLVDKSGRVVLSETPGGGRLGDRPGLGAMADTLLSGEQRAVQYEKGGKTRFLNVRYVPELQWFLFVEKDDERTTAGIVNTLYLNLLVCLIATVLVIALTTVFIGRYQAQLERVATTDPLTGLANRQAYDILMAQALKESDRGTGPLSIAQHFVADDMAEAVVDLLEMVEIHHEEAGGRMRLRGPTEGLLKALAKQAAVGEPGEVVMVGGPTEGLLRQLAVMDVFQCAIPADHRAVLGPSGRGAAADPSLDPAGRADATIHIQVLTQGYGLGPVALAQGHVVGMERLNPTGSQSLLHGPPREVTPARGDIENLPLRIRRPGDLRIQLDRVTVMLLAFAQGRVDPLALERQRGQMQHGLHALHLVAGRDAGFGVVEGEGSKHLAGSREDRLRPAGPQPVRECEITPPCPQGV